nr:protein kinase 4-like [Osmia lignaria]
MNISLNHLIKLLPREFDGDRTKLRSFIKQVDSVFELASPSQKPVLLLFVKNKVEGKARDQIDIHCNLTTWEEVSELLLNLYQDKKSLDQLMEELNSIQQNRNENVSQFYERLEEFQSRILGTIHSTDCEDNTLAGRVAMINEMTLSRFVFHLHPQISQMLRYRDFPNINSALTAAMAEEKALRLRYNNFQHCRICNKSNHSINDCYLGKQRSSPSRAINFNQSSQNNALNNIKQCRYCKNFGHNIEECRKREYNNSRQNNGLYRQSNSNNSQINRQQPNPNNFRTYRQNPNSFNNHSQNPRDIRYQEQNQFLLMRLRHIIPSQKILKLEIFVRSNNHQNPRIHWKKQRRNSIS